MSEINRKLIGRTGLSMAINYFTLQGYTVCLPINDTQWYDLVIEKDGKLQTVQCKATQTINDEISLRNMGGTNGGVYDNLINHSELDYLFCVNKDLNMWCIPMSDLLAAGNKNKIKLHYELIPQQIIKDFKLINTEFNSRTKHKSVATC